MFPPGSIVLYIVTGRWREDSPNHGSDDSIPDGPGQQAPHQQRPRAAGAGAPEGPFGPNAGPARLPRPRRRGARRPQGQGGRGRPGTDRSGPGPHPARRAGHHQGRDRLSPGPRKRHVESDRGRDPEVRG